MDKKVHTLKIKETSVSPVIGISSHENDYRLSWAVNQCLGIKLTKTDNLINITKEISTVQEFSVFKHDEVNHSVYLISNRCDNGFLLVQYKNIDFFMVLKGDTENLTGEVLNAVKKCSLITAAFLISDIPSKWREKFSGLH